MKILGISKDINDSACLLVDGKVVAMAAEERFTRIKGGGNTLPFSAAKYVLKEGGLSLDEIDYITLSWDLNKYPEYMKRFWKNSGYYNKKTNIDKFVDKIHSVEFNPEFVKFQLKIGFAKMGFNKLPKIKFINHHYSHACSTYYPSGFSEAVIIVIDGSGEENATTIWKGVGDEIVKLKEINLPHSLGWFYSAVTEFLGFRAYTGEGKVMGLAPYGEENFEIREKLKKILKKTDEGYEVNPEYIYFGKRTKSNKFTKLFTDNFGEPKKKNEDYSKLHKDLAYEAQKLLEEVVSELVRSAVRYTKIRNVCISGGVGMNCKMNGKIGALNEVDEIYIFPASSDDGSSLGSALSIEKKRINLPNVYLGPKFSNEEIKKVLDLCKLKYTYHENIEEVTAKKIADNNIVGWFQGRMELGARALGNRSILANPLNPEMKDVLNRKVKHRESFRPFCPSILFEEKDKYLKNAKYAPYMILAYEAKELIGRKYPSVVHVDNTVRPQTVREEDNPRYYKLIKNFKELTGEGIILNTSFNIAGEPIVCTPEEAIRCFFGTGIDYLIVGNFLLEK